MPVGLVSTVIINGISCPLTVLLNVLVIMAIKRRPRLQTNTNILMVCLAATDALLTGLLVQPSFILRKTLQLLGKASQKTIDAIRFSKFVSTHRLHVFLASSDAGYGWEAYSYQVYHALPLCITKRIINHAVIVFWILAITWGITDMLAQIYNNGLLFYLNTALFIILISCVIFIKDKDKIR